MKKTLMTEPQGYDLLSQYDIPVPEYRVVHNVDEAIEAAQEIGLPVVLKVVSPQVIHKSDAGGVLMIREKKDVSKGYATIRKNVRMNVPDAQIQGIIVEKMMTQGLELIIGGRTDESFGKIISFGLGGTMVEIMRDFALRVLPVQNHDIKTMIEQIKGYRLIQGYRDQPRGDEEHLVAVIRKISRLFYEDPSIAEMEINPYLLYEQSGCAVDVRVFTQPKTGPAKKRRPQVQASIFEPTSIAVVGASSDPDKLGYSLFRNLLAFPGAVYPVNSHAETILSRKVFSSLEQIPQSLDMAVIAVPADRVPQVIEQAGRKGVKLAVVISSGFKETGAKGEALQHKVKKIAEQNEIRMIGPNCLGIALPHHGINATFDPVTPPRGALAFVSQSGATITTMVDWALQSKRGFSAVISVGNQADLRFDDFLQFLDRDTNTRSIIFYIEEIMDGAKFLETASLVTERTPVIALKAGASEKGRAAASSHTGALAGSHDVYLAAFRQAGIISADSLKQAFQVGELLVSEGYACGSQGLIITNAGGFSVLASDYAEKNEMHVAPLPEEILSELNSFLPEGWSHANPLDLRGDADSARYARVFDLMIANQEFWDIVFVIAVPTAVLDPKHLAQEIVRLSKSTRKMLVACLLGGDSMKSGVKVLDDACVPNFQELQEAFDAVGKALSMPRSARPTEDSVVKCGE